MERNLYETLDVGKTILGESPFWNHKCGSLSWTDFSRKCFYSYSPKSNDIAEYGLWGRPGCVIPAESGGYIMGIENEIGLFIPSERKYIRLSEPEKGKTYNHFNDGKCDVKGRFWLGSITETEDWKGSALYVFHGRNCCERKLDRVTTSNGLTWSLDNRVFYYIDTMEFCVFAFDFAAETGMISNRRVIIDFKNEAGRPDGMTIDEEGCLWIAHWNGGMVSRWDPQNGCCLERISLPAYNVTSCCFGGERLDRLFVTSASINTPVDLLGSYPFCGCVFSLDVGVRGIAQNLFDDSEVVYEDAD